MLFSFYYVEKNGKTISGLALADVQGAIDELYEKAKNHCPTNSICYTDSTIIAGCTQFCFDYICDGNTSCMTECLKNCKVG